MIFAGSYLHPVDTYNTRLVFFFHNKAEPRRHGADALGHDCLKVAVWMRGSDGHRPARRATVSQSLPIQRLFPDDSSCAHSSNARWGDGFVCPHCGVNGELSHWDPPGCCMPQMPRQTGLTVGRSWSASHTPCPPGSGPPTCRHADPRNVACPSSNGNSGSRVTR